MSPDRSLQAVREHTFGIEEDGQFRERITNADRLDIRDFRLSGQVGSHRQRLVGWKLEWLVANLVPNCLVDALRIAQCGRKQIDDQ